MCGGWGVGVRRTGRGMEGEDRISYCVFIIIASYQADGESSRFKWSEATEQEYSWEGMDFS